MIEHNLFVDKIFEVVFCKGELFKIEVVSGDDISGGLIIREVQLLQVRMLQSLLHCYSLLGIVSEHLLE